MHLLFLQKSAGRGGAKSSLLETLAILRGAGEFRLSLLAGEQGPFVERCRELGIQPVLSALPEWRKFIGRLVFGSAMKRAAAHFPGSSPQWVIANEMWQAPHAARLARHFGCRSAVILRDGIATPDKARKYRLHENDRILPVSSTIARPLAILPELQGKVCVVFDSVRLPDDGCALDARLQEQLAGASRVRSWLLVVGKLGSRKNQADAVRVLAELRRMGRRDLGMVLAGDCEAAYREELQQVIFSLGLGEHVCLPGNVDNVGALYRFAEAVLLTSSREGLPRSLVEGLLAAKPAFAYRCEGVEDIYGDELPVFVSPAATPVSLAGIMENARKAPAELAAALGRVGGRLEGQFSPASHLQMLREALR